MAYQTSKSSDAESHQCRWLDCTIVFDTAESLYDHITSTHIGRKSAGTLSLECHWAGCTSRASKRDHLTSHARVHINLKPHTCDICSKSFKRPQDLKKHEKIHTEEHHQHHKHSKAVTVPGTGGATSAAPFSGTSYAGAPIDKNQPMHPAAFPQFPPGYGYGYPFGPHPFMNNPMGAPGPIDVAQVLEHQRQLNAAASAGGFANMPGMQGPAPYGLPYGVGFNMPPGPQMYALPGQNGMPYHFGYPYPMPPLQLPAQQQQQQQQQQQHRATPPPTATSPLQGQAHVVKQESALYPVLPPPLGLYPSLSSPIAPVEDQPSPAHSQHSHHSHHSQHTHRSNPSVNSASVSPKVPSLSPASITNSPYSPSPEQEADASFRRVYSGNAVAGTKRGFEEAAGEFFQDVRSKRYNVDDDSLFRQIEKIDELGLLLNIDMTAPALTPARSQDDSSGSSINSDYHNRPDVENLNDFLLQLGQNLDSLQTPIAPNFNPVSQPAPNHNPYSSSLYPSLPMSNGYDRPTVGMPARNQLYADHSGVASIRHSKAPTAPTIGINDSRLPTYRTMERLQRAPAPGWRETMEIDEEEVSSKYSSSIRSTSLDVATSDSEKPIKLAPIVTAALSTGTGESPRGPQLSPIVSSVDTPTSSKTTLPSIRSLMSYQSTTTPESPAISSAAMSESGSSTGTIVRGSRSPSSSEMARPSTSGGVDRLVHRVTKLGVTSFDDEEPLEESDDEVLKEDDHRPKKTRVASPEPMDEDGRLDDGTAALVARRRATVAALMIMLNARYREHLAAKAQPVPTTSSPSVEVAV